MNKIDKALPWWAVLRKIDGEQDTVCQVQIDPFSNSASVKDSAVEPWTSCLLPLTVFSLICQMGTVTSKRIKLDNAYKHLACDRDSKFPFSPSLLR